MTRVFDLIFSIVGLVVLLPIFILLFIAGLLDTGSPLFMQKRIGKNQKPFTLIKFRTMRKDTESVATHLASASSVTKFGHFLRKTKLDEIPQLINVVLGQMSLVGPRPNLANQTELIEERKKRGIYDVLPGITGLAQVNKVDMSQPEKLAKIDEEMIHNLNVVNYFKYIVLTVTGSGSGDRIKPS
jgi:O-antigen biosynthesis protein WbqP